jgi:hypothetical protein
MRRLGMEALVSLQVFGAERQTNPCLAGFLAQIERHAPAQTADRRFGVLNRPGFTGDL